MTSRRSNLAMHRIGENALSYFGQEAEYNEVIGLYF
jgi:hypothetical protein